MVKRKNLWLVLLAYLTTLVFPSITTNGNINFTYTNGLVSLVLFLVLCYFFIKTFSKTYDNREKFVSIILGLLFDIFLIMGAQWTKLLDIRLFELRVWLNIILLLPLFTALILCFYSAIIPETNGVLTSITSQDFDIKFFDSWIVDGILMILAWIPVLLATYPSNYVYDAGYQLSGYKNNVISLHHPLIHTEMLGFFTFHIGKNLFHNSGLGLFLYTIVQMLWLALALALVIRFMILHNVNPIYRLLVLLFFMFSPFISVLAISPTKNIPYTASFIIFILLLLGMYEKPNRWHSWKYMVLFLITGFVNVIFENQGIYVLILGMLASLIFSRRYWKQVTVLAVLILTLYGFYSGPITRELHGYLDPNDRAIEKMSVPIMQLTDTVSHKESNLKTNERKQIREYIPTYSFYSKGLQDCSDTYKGAFNVKKYRSDKEEFWHLWLTVGMHNINQYMDAFAKLTIGYWYPNMNYPDIHSGKKYLEYYDTMAIHNNNDQGWYKIICSPVNGFQIINRRFNDFCNNISVKKVPIISVLSSVAFNIWFYLLFCGWTVIHKHTQYALVNCLLFGFIGTLLLGPVTLYRYALPVILVNPLLLAIMLTNSSSNSVTR